MLIRDGNSVLQGRNPLHLAAERGYAGAIKALMEADNEIRKKHIFSSGSLWEKPLIEIKDSVSTDSDHERFANLPSQPCCFPLRIVHLPISRCGIATYKLTA